MTEVTEPDPIMQRDVFGPVLPVLTVNTLDDAIAFINRQEKPLCVYAYSSNSKVPETPLLRSFKFNVAADVHFHHMLAFVIGYLKTNE